MQEGTARLTIVSGLSLGQCLRHKYRATPALADTAVICWLVAASIFLGNLLFECNNFAGGVDAVMAMPGARALPPTGLLGIPLITKKSIFQLNDESDYILEFYFKTLFSSGVVRGVQG